MDDGLLVVYGNNATLILPDADPQQDGSKDVVPKVSESQEAGDSTG